MTEAEHKAAYAFERMQEWNLPVLIALDMVQDETGERDVAVEELTLAAFRWLGKRKPVKSTIAIGATYVTVCSLMEDRQWDQAEKERYRLLLISHGQCFAGDVGALWLDWCHECKRAIALCRELEAATSPVPQVTESE